MATVTLIAICLSALVGHSLASPSQASISPAAVGRQAITDFQNNRHSVRYLPRAIHRPYSYPALAPVPFSLSIIDSDNALEGGLSPGRRHRRQAGAAMDLALSHADARGRERPVGKVYGFGDLSVTGNSRSHHHVAASAGVGSVVWRSNNDRHSVGVGATVDHHRGSFDGIRYSSRPSPSVGIGYRMRF